MKTLILSCLATAAFLSFSACTTVEDRHAHTPVVQSTTTTTEETTVHRPVSATTETRTIRSY